jgi:hypothetical protein
VGGAWKSPNGTVGLSEAASPTRPCRADVVASYDLGVEAYEKLWSPVILPAAVALVPWLGLGVGSVVADIGTGTRPSPESRPRCACGTWNGSTASSAGGAALSWPTASGVPAPHCLPELYAQESS